jgi:2-polyprenyl-6-methoxyphenol hydroxylase-like FAD-dependent oxidoreductase
MNVLIIGGGIGGLATALSLHAAGIDAQVYESVAHMKAVGVGINLQPNAVRELIELGLGDDLASTAIETAELGYFNKYGQLIWSEPRGLAAGYAWPQYSIDRGELQMILLAAVKSRIGAENVFPGHHLVSFEQDSSGVRVRFIDRRSGEPLPPKRGDVLIGCDGTHSAVRAQLYPMEGEPISSGRIQWRGILDAEPFLGGRTHVTMGFSEQRAVVYPTSKKLADRGRSRLNWMTVLGRQAASSERGTWDRKVSKDRFFHRFSSWNFGWLKFADLICDTDEIYEYPKEDRDPLPRWSFGRVSLLGDAAHPMLPIGAQAGSQAIVDARVLAFALAASPSPESGLQQYESQRRPMMSAVTLKNRQFGPAVVMEIAEQRAPNGFDNIEAVMTRHELEEISMAYKVQAGFDPATFNKRASLQYDGTLREEHIPRF